MNWSEFKLSTDNEEQINGHKTTHLIHLVRHLFTEHLHYVPITNRGVWDTNSNYDMVTVAKKFSGRDG